MANFYLVVFLFFLFMLSILFLLLPSLIFAVVCFCFLNFSPQLLLLFIYHIFFFFFIFFLFVLFSRFNFLVKFLLIFVKYQKDGMMVGWLVVGINSTRKPWIVTNIFLCFCCCLSKGKSIKSTKWRKIKEWGKKTEFGCCCFYIY